MILEVFRTFLTIPANFSHHFNSDWCRKQVWRRSGGHFLARVSLLALPANFSHHFNSDWCRKQVRRRLGGQFMTRKHPVCVSETYTFSLRATHSLSGQHILSPDNTIYLRDTQSISRRHNLSPGDSLSPGDTVYLLGTQSILEMTMDLYIDEKLIINVRPFLVCAPLGFAKVEFLWFFFN